MSKDLQKDFSSLSQGYEGIGEFYDLFVDDSDIPFYLKMAKLIGSPILELAAGTARVSLALAREGFEIMALEKSPSMLAVARRKVQAEPREVSTRIHLIEGNMEDFNVARRFALIIIPNSFGHALTRDAQIATLKCVREHLLSDGLFILDLYVGEAQYSHATFSDPPAQFNHGTTVERQGEIHTDSDAHLMRIDLRYTMKNADGSILDIVNVSSGAALFFKGEAEGLLEEIGLEVVDEFGDFDGTPFDEESSRRILILKTIGKDSKQGQ